MPKYYVIPIDNANRGYFGVRAYNNPYTGALNWCSGTPNVFGGNAQGTAVNTIYLETREESHFKIDITQLNLVAGGAGANFQQIHQSGAHGGMTFYAIRDAFLYHAAPYFPMFLANQAKYQETTGDVFRLDMTTVNTAHRTSAAGDVMRAMQAQVGPRPLTSKASAEFLGSEMAEAIRLTAAAVQAGTL